MPPAYFLNVSTLSVLAALGHLSQRERQGMLARYIKHIILLCLFTVSCRRLLRLSFSYAFWQQNRQILHQHQYASFSARYAFSSLMGMRTCSMESRSRTVTQLSPAFSASPTVSKSTVMQ